MKCAKCGAWNLESAKFCSQCAAPMTDAVAEATRMPSDSAMSGAEALAITGEKTALWSQNTMAGYSMSKRALEELNSQGQGDSDAAQIATRGMNIAKAKWIVGGILFVIAAIVMISIASHMGNQPTYP